MTFEGCIALVKEIEGLLETTLGASGRGLHDKATSVEERLDESQLGRLRFIATLRNKLIHEAGFDVNHLPDNFEDTCRDLISELRPRPVSKNVYKPLAAPSRLSDTQPVISGNSDSGKMALTRRRRSLPPDPATTGFAAVALTRTRRSLPPDPATTDFAAVELTRTRRPVRRMVSSSLEVGALPVDGLSSQRENPFAGYQRWSRGGHREKGPLSKDSHPRLIIPRIELPQGKVVACDIPLRHVAEEASPVNVFFDDLALALGLSEGELSAHLEVLGASFADGFVTSADVSRLLLLLNSGNGS
ncbi:hypothetical protein [Alcanivorax sp. 1008]|uniref:hypothetical protein n=1 Tax=Alcanivorax sp. 1008 TaxID=2816853 RepID=UPI001D4397F0|nr:hypothetical protein [Alcanivorax sp. 1008]MCC1496815.1 hypothetical protein [Alcanivorax sp. 1008]